MYAALTLTTAHYIFKQQYVNGCFFFIEAHYFFVLKFSHSCFLLSSRLWLPVLACSEYLAGSPCQFWVRRIYDLIRCALVWTSPDSYGVFRRCPCWLFGSGVSMSGRHVRSLAGFGQLQFSETSFWSASHVLSASLVNCDHTRPARVSRPIRLFQVDRHRMITMQPLALTGLVS